MYNPTKQQNNKTKNKMEISMVNMEAKLSERPSNNRRKVRLIQT